MQKITKELYILNGKEYTLAELDQLRSEFIYLSESTEKLVVDIEKLKKNKEITANEIQLLREGFDKEVEKKEQELLVKDNKLNIELVKKEKEIKAEQIKNIELLKELEIKETELNQKTIEFINNERDYDKKNIELSIKIQKENNYIEEKRKFLSLEKKELEVLKDGYNQTIIDNKNMIEKYQSERKEREKNKLIFQEEEVRLKSLREYVETNIKDIKKKEESLEISLYELNNKKELLDKQEENVKSSLQELESKEMSIIKRIADFQEEKYKFFMIMKQQGIKKNDLDKLDKEFNL